MVATVMVRKRMLRDMVSRRLGFFLVVLGLLSACSPRNIIYFSDVGEEKVYKAGPVKAVLPKMQAGDKIGLKIITPNPETNAMFSYGVLMDGGQKAPTGAPASTGGEGYLIDQEGFTVLPLVGRIQLGGLNKDEAAKKIEQEMKKFIKGDTFVSVQLVNFKVTVLGEVGGPSVLNVTQDKINLLDVLGMVGDLTLNGKRENIMVIREENGERVFARVDLNSKDIFDSPYFYLKQNDVIYVEPDKMKISQTNLGRRDFLFGLGLLTTAIMIFWRVGRVIN
jgi:polysaccharide biosynthesis/export protein